MYCCTFSCVIDSSLAHASCQFDAPKFAAWLKELAPQRPNIRHIDAIMSAFEQNAESGFVESVTLDNGQIVTGDFFIDCSGFRRQLFQKAFTPKWIDYSQYIKVDSAIPVSVEYKYAQPPRT